jgi:hypothetical protein
MPMQRSEKEIRMSVGLGIWEVVSGNSLVEIKENCTVAGSMERVNSFVLNVIYRLT